MYVIRRVYKVKPGTTRRAAEVLTQIGRAYQDAGQRPPFRVYTSGGTVPGPANTIYMEWEAESILSPMREGNRIPEAVGTLGAQLAEMQEETYIEFYEMYYPR
jgi:hypothetical protein